MAGLLGASHRAELERLVDASFLRERVTPKGLDDFLKRRDARHLKGRHLLVRVLRRRRRAAPRTPLELEALLARVLERNHVPLPERLKDFEGATPAVRLGYPKLRIAVELGGAGFGSEADERARAALRGQGFRLIGLSHEKLRQSPRAALKELRAACAQPPPPSSASPLPAYRELQMRHHLFKLVDRRQLPPALQAKDIYQYVFIMDMQDFEQLSAEELEAMRAIIHQLNSAPTLGSAGQS
jgi:hypothetical protein